MFAKPFPSRRTFTLIELLVVIASMVLLSAFLFWRIDPTRPLVPSAEQPAATEEPACV
jgi:hypothetical protein